MGLPEAIKRLRPGSGNTGPISKVATSGQEVATDLAREGKRDGLNRNWLRQAISLVAVQINGHQRSTRRSLPEHLTLDEKGNLGRYDPDDPAVLEHFFGVEIEDDEPVGREPYVRGLMGE